MFKGKATKVDTKKAVPLKTRRTGKKTFIYVMYNGKKTELSAVAKKEAKRNENVKSVYMRMFYRVKRGITGKAIWAPVAK
jgi:hypothetical protein